MAFGEDGVERPHLDGIAQGRPGAVGLDVAYFARRYPGVLQRPVQQFFLGPLVGYGKSAARAVVVDGRTANHRENIVLIGNGIRQAFQYHDPAPFTANEAVGARIEGLATSIRGQGMRPRTERRGLRHEIQVDATREGQSTFRCLQTPAGEMNGGQRGGTGRIRRQRGSLEAQRMGEPSRCEGETRAGHRIGGNIFGMTG
uniref:Uncharacterized protein n=1 Tax=Candidatus Kentrum sp. LFY TaxID=2126342 RepID=A0A450UUP6_9GAMM|nr:MAG: hypothetical protein BECKLFY1418A_GA0070994_105718 [Candidatus Kentron sp. LFY]